MVCSDQKPAERDEAAKVPSSSVAVLTEAIQRAYALLWSLGPTFSEDLTTVRRILLDALGGRGSELMRSALANYAPKRRQHDHSGHDFISDMLSVCGNLNTYCGIMNDGPDDSDEALADRHFALACQQAADVCKQFHADDLGDAP